MKKISRREFLFQSAACACGVAVWGALPWFETPKALASSGNGTKVLFVNMNGGWDGLYLLQPLRGQNYSTLASLRPTLIRTPENLLAINDDYGFHKNLSVLRDTYQQGQLATIFNVGYHNMSRSHEDAEVVYAQGVPDRLNPASSGFINRLGAEYRWHNMQAVSVSGSDRSFEGGEYRGVQVEGLDNFKFSSDYSVDWQESIHRQNSIYSVSQSWTTNSDKPRQQDIISNLDLLVNSSGNVQAALRDATFTAEYPETDFGRKLKDIDVLFSNSSFGTEVGYLRRGGFDTHSEQAENIDETLTELNTALGTFITNMKAKNIWNNLVIVLVSEFGRTTQENDSQGTDHGGALPVFLLGGGVRGGLIGGIQTADLTADSWLPMHYNIVDIYRSILSKMNYDPDRVFSRSNDASLPQLFV